MEIKVATYARFSSTNQREASIEIQHEHIHKYCKENGLTIVREYVDRAQSATNDNRPEFQQMINDSALGIFSYIIIYNSSRFARNIQDHLKYRAILNSNNVKLVSVQDGFDETTPEGDLMSNFMMSINQYYSKDLARKTFLGSLEQAKECKHVGGIPPLGYGVGPDKKYYIIEEEAKIVRYIFSQVESGASYKEIADELNRRGLKNKMGREFNCCFTDLLTNRKYIGEYVWNKVVARTALGLRSSRIIKDESNIIRVPNGMPAIISKQQFDAVQAILESRKTDNHRLRISDYLLTSLLVCNNCNFRMTGYHCTCNSGGTTTIKRTAYRCESRYNHDTACTTTSIAVLNLDTYITNLLVAVLVNERYANNFYNIILREISKNKRIAKTRIDTLTTEAKELGDEIQELASRLSTAKNLFYQDIVNEIERKTSQKLDKELEIDSLKNSIAVSPVVTRDIIRDRILMFKNSIKTRDKRDIKRVLKVVLKEIRFDNEKVVVRVNLKAYLTSCPYNSLTIDIVEDTDNIRKRENQYKQGLVWNRLKICYSGSTK